MKYILHIETSTKVCSVALSCNGNLKFFKESNDDAYAHGEQLTVYIQEVLAESGISPKELAAVSVTSGPGSYTGLRIGVSVAKGLCYALSIPLISIDSLLNLAVIAAEKHSNSTLCPMIDARRLEVYNAIYTPELTYLKEISADILDENSYSSFEPFVYFGDGASKMEELWNGRNSTIDHSIICSAKGHAKIAYSKFCNSEFEDVAYFEPFYLKDFQGGKKVSTN